MKPPWRRLDRARVVQALVACFVTLAFSFLLERDDAPGETALALQARILDRGAAGRVKVVRIDDADYHSLFGGHSPMDSSVVARIVHAIAAGRPAVIGIDIESINPAYATLPDSIAGVPIVWARQFRCMRDGVLLARCTPGERIPQPAAGREEPGPERAGFVMLSRESDGSVRQYERMVPTARGPFPTFTTAVLKQAGRPVEAEEGFRLIRFRRTSAADAVFTAQWVLDAAGEEGFARDGVFRDRIVLLGGTFLEGRDWHITPMGDLAGVEVLAQILETELDGGGPRPPGTAKFFLIQFLVGIAIVAIFHFCRKRKSAFLIALGLCLAVAPAASLVLFGTWKLWFYFLPAVFTWLVQQVYDVAKGYRDRVVLGVGRQEAPAYAIDVIGRLPPPAAAGPADAAPALPLPPASRKDEQRKRNRRRRGKRRSPSRR